MRAATLHVAAELLGSVAAVTAAMVIVMTGWSPIDPILSALVLWFPAVIDVHHVHAWSIMQERPMVTLHAWVSTSTLPEAITAAIKARLDERLRVARTTVEVERDQCADDGNPQCIRFHAEEADG